MGPCLAIRRSETCGYIHRYLGFVGKASRVRVLLLTQAYLPRAVARDAGGGGIVADAATQGESRGPGSRERPGQALSGARDHRCARWSGDGAVPRARDRLGTAVRIRAAGYSEDGHHQSGGLAAAISASGVLPTPIVEA